MIDRISYSAPSYVFTSRGTNADPGQAAAESSPQPPASANGSAVNNPVKAAPAIPENKVIPFPAGQPAYLGNRKVGSDTTVSAAVSAYNKTAEDSKVSDRLLKRLGLKECETCSERRYQDESSDPGVSFKSPTHIAPESAGAAVAAHEQEHVRNQQTKAAQEEKQVVSQSVQLYTSTCPECGKTYVSGGETRTVTITRPVQAKNDSGIGQILDSYA